MDDFPNFAKSSSLKEPQEKCNQFPYFEKSSFFEKTSKQIQGNFFTNLLHIKFCYKEPQAFAGVRVELEQN